MKTSSDLPPQGTHSLFDYLTQGEIPYPFEALLEKITKEIDKKARIFSSSALNPVTFQFDLPISAAKPAAVLFPFSRSLQRKFASPEFPRIVVAVDGWTPTTSEDLGFSLQNKLYIGYSEKAQQLEIISYNEAAGRFEFQIVKNYGVHPSQPAEVYYVKREFCLACHQNEGPIFTRGPWTETNDPIDSRKSVRKMVLGAHKSESSYHGVSIAPANSYEFNGYSGEVPGESSYRIQNSIQSAQGLARLQYVWRMCDSNPQTSLECRMELIKFLLDPDLNSRFNHRERVKSLLAGTFPSGKFPSFDYYDSFLEDFDPIANQGYKSGSDAIELGPNLSKSSESSLKELTEEHGFPKEFEPLNRKARLHLSSLEALLTFDFVPPLFSPADKALLTHLFGSWAEIEKQLDEMAKDSKIGIHNSLNYKMALQRTSVLSDLVSAKTRRPILHSGQETLNLPPPRLAPESSASNNSAYQDRNLAKFWKNCSSCHSSGDYVFLGAKSETEAWKTLKEWAPKIIKVLDWNAKPVPAVLMPPSAKLRTEMGEGERLELLRLVKTLVPSQF